MSAKNEKLIVMFQDTQNLVQRSDNKAEAVMVAIGVLIAAFALSFKGFEWSEIGASITALLFIASVLVNIIMLIFFVIKPRKYKKTSCVLSFYNVAKTELEAYINAIASLSDNEIDQLFLEQIYIVSQNLVRKNKLLKVCFFVFIANIVFLFLFLVI